MFSGSRWIAFAALCLSLSTAVGAQEDMQTVFGAGLNTHTIFEEDFQGRYQTSLLGAGLFFSYRFPLAAEGFGFSILYDIGVLPAGFIEHKLGSGESLSLAPVRPLPLHMILVGAANYQMEFASGVLSVSLGGGFSAVWSPFLTADTVADLPIGMELGVYALTDFHFPLTDRLAIAPGLLAGYQPLSITAGVDQVIDDGPTFRASVVLLPYIGVVLRTPLPR